MHISTLALLFFCSTKLTVALSLLNSLLDVHVSPVDSFDKRYDWELELPF